MEIRKLTSIIAHHFIPEDFWRKNKGKGIGKLLLDYVKSRRTVIQLKVYQKNEKSISFYKSQGFTIKAANNDIKTGEKEFLMEWKK